MSAVVPAEALKLFHTRNDEPSGTLLTPGELSLAAVPLRKDDVDAITFHPSTAVPAVIGTPLSQLSAGKRLSAFEEVSITLPPLQMFADVGESKGAAGTAPTLAVVVCTQPLVLV
jgi:hypothetical protein